MANYPQPLEKRLMAKIRQLEQAVKRLEHLAADPVAIGTQLARTSIQSPNYLTGQAGWILNADGTGEFTTTVAGGTVITIGPTPPATPKIGDLWFDSTNNYVMNQWDGTQWNPYQFGTNALAAGSITAGLIAANAIVAGMIAAGAIDGMTINGVQINGNQINATDILISGVNSGIFVYGGGVGGTNTYTVSGSWVCPANTTTLTVELWAGGGGGGGNGGAQQLISAGAGAGGMYTRWTYPVTPGNTYSFTIGAAGVGGSGTGVSGTPGGDSTFDNTAATPLRSTGGDWGRNGNGGANGGAASLTPPTVPAGATLLEWQPGGNGGDGKSNGPAGGGGGGGSGAPGYAGNNGHDGAVGVGGRGYGAAAVPGGGPGGNGGGATGAPFTGSAPSAGYGGGGGGAGGDGNNRAGGNGWKGKMVLTWTPSVVSLTGSLSGQQDSDPISGSNVPEGAMFDRETITDTPPGGVVSWPASSVEYSNSGQRKYISTDGNNYAMGRLTIPGSAATLLTTSMQTMGNLTVSLTAGMQYRVIARLLIAAPTTSGQGALSYRTHASGGLVASGGRCAITELFATSGVGLADHAGLDTTLTGSAPGTGGANREVLFDGWFTITTSGQLSIQMAQAATAACQLAFAGSYLEILPIP